MERSKYRYLNLIALTVFCMSNSIHTMNQEKNQDTGMKIIKFDEQYKDQVIQLVSFIQRQEFHVNITPEEQPDLQDIKGYFKDGNFWIAVDQGQVVGTIGLCNLGNGNGALKKMFVRADYRGTGIAQQLLKELLMWVTEHSYKMIYIGTVSVVYAAHRFYEKNGFIEISQEELPVEFRLLPQEKKFYKYTL